MAHLKEINLSIGEFALPSPRKGSIDSLSGFGKGSELGIEIHKRVQEERRRWHPSYKAEVSIAHSIEFGEHRFNIKGRMDGVFESNPFRIEEIKSAFKIKELRKRLEDEDHPFSLQLRTYGYFYWLQTGQIPELLFHLVSSRNFSAESLVCDLNLSSYRGWLDRRLEELVLQAKRAEKKLIQRKESATTLNFPFTHPRPGQLDLMKSVEQGIKEGKRMLFQAPTGLGKTMGVLFPVMREALSRGQRMIYLTPKNSQHLLAEEAVERLQLSGAKIRSLTITAKSKICFKGEPICNPDFCEFARDYYTKVAEHGLLEVLAKKKKLNARTFKKVGKDFEVCPFELQLDASEEAEVVICDYNYAFAPRATLSKLSSSRFDQEGKPNLVIDEAHNLPIRAMGYFSPELSSQILSKIRGEFKALPPRFREDAYDLIDRGIEIINDCQPREKLAPCRITPPHEPFWAHEEELRSFLSRYLESDIEIETGDPVMRFCFYWSEFTAALEYVSEREEFFTTFHPLPGGGRVKVTCCDASRWLKESYGEYENVVAFSATLKPFDYYFKLSGLEEAELKTAEFRSPFLRKNRKLLIIPQISSKFSDRGRNYPRIASVIERIASEKTGNYFAFFPSFEFLNGVFEQFVPPEGFRVIRQERHMKQYELVALLEELRSAERANLVFAVQGGVLSEGIDYAGNMAIGAFVVGPALPAFDLEREEMRKYYEKKFLAGFDFAYTYPAMAKSVQAAGRVIRSEEDKGIIVLMDDRFLQQSFVKSMPEDWFEKGAEELVSRSILKEVREFWNQSEG